jgi:hypothetical protein
MLFTRDTWKSFCGEHHKRFCERLSKNRRYVVVYSSGTGIRGGRTSVKNAQAQILEESTTGIVSVLTRQHSSDATLAGMFLCKKRHCTSLTQIR